MKYIVHTCFPDLNIPGPTGLAPCLGRSGIWRPFTFCSWT